MQTWDGSNNTNKLSPQEPSGSQTESATSSNNTNKLSPQEPSSFRLLVCYVQIIQINLVLKNPPVLHSFLCLFK